MGMDVEWMYNVLGVSFDIATGWVLTPFIFAFMVAVFIIIMVIRNLRRIFFSTLQGGKSHKRPSLDDAGDGS